MSIQIHQLNELTSPALSDVVAVDNGTDTGKVSIDAVAGLVLNDYKFGDNNESVAEHLADIATEISGVDAKFAPLDDKYAHGKVLTELTNFKYAYRIPADAPFTANDIITWAIFEKQVYYDGQWYYGSENPGYAGEFNTIPLYNTADPSEVLNVNGKSTTCSTAICNILYNCGYTDLEGDAKWASARVKKYSFPYYLEQKGWTKITNIPDLAVGDIVFVRDSLYPDERRFNPSHSFIFAGDGKAYDFGSTTLIRNNSTSNINWKEGGNQATSSWHPTLFGFTGSTTDPEATGNSEWSGIATQRIYADGYYGLLAEMQNPNSLCYADYVTTYDTSASKYTTNKVVYPIVNANTNHGIRAEARLHKSGIFEVTFNGTADANLNAGTTYTIFSFNTFENAAQKQLAQQFNAYVQFTESNVVRVFTDVSNGVSRLRYTPVTQIASGTEVHAQVVMFLR